MSKIFLTIVFAAAVAMGCDSTDTLGGGGAGGAGGMGGGTIGPLTWVASDITVVGMDECNFFNPDEALMFEMTIDGSTLTLVQSDGPSVSTDNYFDTADEVIVSGSAEDSTQDPCIVMLDDAMQLGLDNPDVSIDQNDTLSVTWNHVEEDISSAYDDACTLDDEGNPLDPILWFADLPCSGEATMTLTQSPAP
ncbi:MAG: hypothetical protein HKN10_03650 [Myxococcales bacterium]|nr:hypothetical protein [Myxococcales bacterium]